ncbi:endonuclease III domain-containing protein [Nanoarchaeota archaeon]
MKNPQIIKILKKKYSAKEFSTHHSTPYQVLIACILSLRTKDEVTYPAAKRLFILAKTPQNMIKLNESKIQKTIYPVGFYKRKSKTIKDISKKIIKDYKSNVPNTVEELVKLKGVGRKTANIVVTYGHGKPGIAVDTHVHRISNRLGIVKTKTPEQTEFKLRKILPRKYWIDFNELLVRHGQNTCKPISPFCSICEIRKYCKRVNVTTSR